MAKGNDFKKPVNNEENIINEEDNNKRLITIIILSIIVVLGLIIASISYFNSNDVESDKKNKKPDDKKPIEVIDPPVVDEPKDDVVVPTTPAEVVVNQKPKPPVVVVTPEEPVIEESPLISSVNENDYTVTMDGNTAIVSGVSRLLAISEDGAQNIVELKVMLDKNYKLEDLNDLVVTTTTNGVTDNTFNHVIQTDETTGELYFYWRQAVGNGYEKPTSFTILYGDGFSQSYNIDLNGLNIETNASESESELVVVPTEGTGVDSAYSGLDFPYTVNVFRQLTSEEIEWLETNTDEENSGNENIGSENTSEENTSNENIDSENTNDDNTDDTTITDNELLDEDNTNSDEEPEDPIIEPDYSKDLEYTIRFGKGENYENGFTEEYKSAFDGTVVKEYDKILVVKVYAPVIDKDGEIVSINPENVIITGTKPDGEEYIQVNETVSVEETEESTRYYTYLYYAADEGVTENPTFTIDWDGMNDDYGTYSYHFDLSGLEKEDANDNVVDDTTDTENIENTEEVVEENTIEENVEDTTPETSESNEEIGAQVLEENLLDVDTQVEGTLN